MFFVDLILINIYYVKNNAINYQLIILKMLFDAVKLSQDLIKFPSISGSKTEIIHHFADLAGKIGFKSDILTFSGDGGSYEVDNVHCLYNPNNSKNILYFAGHLDVVPVGDKKSWKYDPFLANIDNDTLYGRGAVDMKCAIAAFVAAASEFLQEDKNCNFGIGLLITGDEEAESINGTKKMLKWMSENNKIISNCIVGEPTSSNEIGDIVKIGRRGSVSFSLRVNGKQGHVAYPENAINPISMINDVAKMLNDHNLDEGNEFFDPSNLEFTSIFAPDVSGNVIPDFAEAKFNIRFNDSHKAQDLIDLVDYVCSKTVIDQNYVLQSRVSGDAFLTKPGFLSDLITKSIAEAVGIKSKLSTSGGTSDARFIKDFCPVAEIGAKNKTAHQIDENIAIKDIIDLKIFI